MEMNKNTIILTVVSVVAIFGFLIGAYLLTNRPETPPDTTVHKELTQVKADDRTKWSPAKKHILVEFSDLQCPACKAFHDYIRTNIEQSKDNAAVTKTITFVYKNYPLPTVHKNAFNAAYAAEAAGRQGKFYQMADIMFDKQTEWEGSNNPMPYFENIAKQLKLDMEKYKKDVNSKEVKDKVAADQSLGDSIGVNATPTFYLDGVKVDVNQYSDFVTLLKETGKK